MEISGRKSRWQLKDKLLHVLIRGIRSSMSAADSNIYVIAGKAKIEREKYRPDSALAHLYTSWEFVRIPNLLSYYLKLWRRSAQLASSSGNMRRSVVYLGSELDDLILPRAHR